MQTSINNFAVLRHAYSCIVLTCCINLFVPAALADHICGPSGPTRLPTGGEDFSEMCIHCGGVPSGAWPNMSCNFSAPPPTRIMNFSRIATIRRCEGLGFDHPELLPLARRLRQDPFSNAFRIFYADLEALDHSFRGFGERVTYYDRNKCRPYNEDASAFDSAALHWNQSNCVTGIPEYEAAACRARELDLLNTRSALVTRSHGLLEDHRVINEEFRELSARTKRTVLNAENALNPQYTEQAFRLYILHLLKEQGQPPPNSCQTFARIATVLGKRVANQDLFIDYLVRNVVNVRSDVAFFAGVPPFTPLAGRTFNASGFKQQFYRDIDENQVRHTAGFMLAGYEAKFGGMAPAAAASAILDLILPRLRAEGKAEQEDYYAALVAAQLGYRLWRGTYNASDFGDAISAELCN